MLKEKSKKIQLKIVKETEEIRTSFKKPTGYLGDLSNLKTLTNLLLQ